MPDPWLTEVLPPLWEVEKYACKILRGRSGVLCGYVGVPTDNPAYGFPYYCGEYPIEQILAFPAMVISEAKIQSQINAVQVHGGLTFSGGKKDIPDLSLPWHWFGFDCAHDGDYCPNYDYTYFPKGIYRDLDYVKKEVEGLLLQLQSIRREP